MAVPLRQGKFKTMMVLRAITLIDSTFTQVQKVMLSYKRTYQTNSPSAIKDSSPDYQTKWNSSNSFEAKSWLPRWAIIRDQGQAESYGNWYATAKGESWWIYARQCHRTQHRVGFINVKPKCMLIAKCFVTWILLVQWLYKQWTNNLKGKTVETLTYCYEGRHDR